ncbi:MAG: hypothetical protein EA379_04390 [Phycisphaerales bacterium]|nr:MAG: hypothetical protein EA379_04390 [Phycisphaerales bacterium]
MEPTREDILIGRVTDAEAAPDDWRELEALAAADPGVWTRLAAAQRAHALLERGVEDVLTVAELIDAPDASAARSGAAVDVAHRWRAYAGWAAAAMIGVAWAGVSGVLPGASSPSGVPGAPGGQGVITAGPPRLAPDELMERYLDTGRAQGRVLAELPMVMVESRPLESGEGAEVIYLRQVLERVIVRDMFEVGADELGRPTVAPVMRPSFTRTDPI